MATLAGYTPLREMMQKAIAQGVEKLAAAEGSTPKKVEDKTTVIEKTASVNDGIDFRNPEHMEKLAAALEEAGEKIAAGFMGGEQVSGETALENNTPVGGKQVAKKDPAASKNPPTNPPMRNPPDDGKGPPTAMKTNRTDPAPGGGKMPKKGVFKTASSEIVSKLKTKVGKPVEKTAAKTESKAGALEFIVARMDKVAYGEVEKRQGGTTLDSASESGVTMPVGDGNSDRQFIKSVPKLKAMTKKDAKATEKRQMKEVLTEPMQSASKDHKVQDNLRNASKGGVKIAADVSKALVEKIASEGCKCSGEGTCRFCSMKAKVEDLKKTGAQA